MEIVGFSTVLLAHDPHPSGSQQFAPYQNLWITDTSGAVPLSSGEIVPISEAKVAS